MGRNARRGFHSTERKKEKSPRPWRPPWKEDQTSRNWSTKSKEMWPTWTSIQKATKIHTSQNTSWMQKNSEHLQKIGKQEHKWQSASYQQAYRLTTESERQHDHAGYTKSTRRSITYGSQIQKSQKKNLYILFENYVKTTPKIPTNLHEELRRVRYATISHKATDHRTGRNSEFLDVGDELIPIDQIKSIKYNTISDGVDLMIANLPETERSQTRFLSPKEKKWQKKWAQRYYKTT